MSHINRRYLCVYLPRWPIQRVMRHIGHNAPVVLTRQRAQQLSVAHACEQAEQDGIRNGMPLSLARALCPQARIYAWDGRSDVRALYRIALRADNLSPICSLDPELIAAYKCASLDKLSPLHFGLILDLSGMQRLYNSEQSIVEKISARFARVGIKCRCALTATIGSAWALSRFAPSTQITIAAHTSLRTALATLPLAALRLPEQILSGLYLVGLKQIRDVLQLAPKELAARFGVETLRRIDQALGYVEERISAIPRPSIFKVCKRFEIPICGHAPLCLAVLCLFEELFAALLAKRHRAALFRIVISGKRDSGDLFCDKRELSLTSATKSFKHLQSIIAPILEKWPLPAGATLIQVHAKRLEHASEEQRDFLQAHDLQQLLTQSSEFLNCLSSAIGENNIRQIGYHESFIPERSFEYAPLCRRIAATYNTPIFTINRPPQLLRKPEQITALAMLPDKAPARIVWKGEELKILSAVGPERIAPEWWQQYPETVYDEREYFRLQDQRGRWLWVFRERKSLFWFIHGLW
ncbi:MAG: DNA polymerase Y family protein [Oligoflexia bacterium]|nr:DNA polymerase Y family protein [Oligoflexia bacterium]